jgi:hypothetical protein
MSTAAYLYPWDVVGDPSAAPLMAGLGLDHVVLAAAYHGIRALTPRHPRHRVVTVAHSATYHEAFDEARAALAGAGLPAHAWVVFNHVDLPAPVDHNVVNAYGDRYPWALCPARDATLEAALGIAADVADLPGITGVELEACGWFGFDHLGAHDKTSGVPLGPAERYAMSLCFCGACRESYADEGVSASSLRDAVRVHLDDVFGGSAPPPLDLSAVTSARQRVADRFREAVVGLLRTRRPSLEILLHTNPSVEAGGAFTGADPARAASLVDGRVVNCWNDFSTLTASVAVAGPVHASLLAVQGMGGRALAGQVAAASALGAAGIRFYHAGLASSRDLDAIREACTRGDRG